MCVNMLRVKPAGGVRRATKCSYLFRFVNKGGRKTLKRKRMFVVSLEYVEHGGQHVWINRITSLIPTDRDEVRDLPVTLSQQSS